MERTTDEFGIGDINLKIVSRSIIETAKEELKQEEFREQVVKNLERELLDYDEELNTKFSDTKSNN